MLWILCCFVAARKVCFHPLFYHQSFLHNCIESLLSIVMSVDLDFRVGIIRLGLDSKT
jgi:hypothetical protein